MKKIILITCFSLFILPFALALPPVAGLSSLQKIDKALVNNEINAAEAAGLKVLVFFQDSELPIQYHSDADAIATTLPDLILDDSVRLLPDMSEALAQRVYSYMIPPPFRPTTKNNFVSDFPTPERIPNQDWTYVENISSEIRVWYQKDQDDQMLLALKVRSLLSDEIIPAERNLMGRSHIRDDLNSKSILVRAGIERAQPNGGDGKFDVYIWNIPNDSEGGTKAWVSGYDVDDQSGVGCPLRPSYMSLNLAWAKTADPKSLASTLAHEYFHAIQYTYNKKAECSEYTKMNEGTATYIKQFVYPKYNDEHEWWEFSENGRLSLMDDSYATWPFYYFMTEMQGTASIPKLYELMSSYRGMESVDKTLSGGFKKQWIDYATYEWNQDPLQDGFRQWDDYNIVPGRGVKDATKHLPPIKVEKVTLDQNGQYNYTMNMELKPLTRDFYAFDVSNLDIRTIAIANPVFYNGRKVNAKVLVRKKGQSQYEEVMWEDTQRQEYHYCFDKKNEDIDLIVIVVGNYQYQNSGTTYHGQSAFKVSNQGCYGFNGKISSHWDFKEGQVSHHLDVDASNVELREGEHGPEGVFKNRFYVQNAIVTYNYKGDLGECHGEKIGFMEPDLGKTSYGLSLASYNVAPEAWGQYVVGVNLKDPFISVTYVCPFPKPPITAPVAVIVNSSVGTTYSLTHGKPQLIDHSDENNWKAEWNFSPVKE